VIDDQQTWAGELPEINVAGRSEMHSVGIDIGKRQHVAAICRQGERTADRPVPRFDVDRAGLADLERWLARHGPVERVVMESSGQYWLPLAAALHRHSIPVAIINPVSAKAFGKRRLQRIKSDPADAYPRCPGMADEPWTREPLAGAELREAARFAMHLVEEQSRIDNKICRLIELGPETSWHMAKTGNVYVRAALYRMSVVGLQHNPTIAAHYARKRAQGSRRCTPSATA